MPIERFPRLFRRPAYRVRNFMLTDSTAMIILGLGIVARGISYLPVLGPPPPTGSHPAESHLSMTQWGVVWIVIGTLCLVAAFTHVAALDIAALSTGVGINCLWGFSFIQGTWAAGDGSRLWVSSIGYFSIVAFALWAIWRGKRGDAPMASERSSSCGSERGADEF